MGISSLWNSTDSSLEQVVWAFFVGTVAAAVMAWYNLRFLGRAVKRLNKKSANSIESALTLKDIGLDNFFIRHALARKDGTLRKTVYCTNEKQKLNKADFSDARFYIPEELRIRADLKYESKNSSLVMVIISVVLMFIAAVLALKYIPWLFDMFEKFKEG